MDTEAIGAMIFNYSDRLVFVCRYCLEAKGWTGPERGEAIVTSEEIYGKTESELRENYRCVDCGRVGDNIFP